MLARQPARIIPAHILASGRSAQAQDSLSSPLERNPQSSKGWKKREADGVGLAIVAALEKPGPVACRASKIAVIEQKLAPVAVKPGDTGGDFPVADFLSSCYLCRKKLHGRDIYMYRGEKAFCSMECRYQQIVSDECMEKCSSGILIRQSEIESVPCTGDRRLLFSTGITAL